MLPNVDPSPCPRPLPLLQAVWECRPAGQLFLQSNPRPVSRGRSGDTPSGSWQQLKKTKTLRTWRVSSRLLWSRRSGPWWPLLNPGHHTRIMSPTRHRHRGIKESKHRSFCSLTRKLVRNTLTHLLATHQPLCLCCVHPSAAYLLLTEKHFFFLFFFGLWFDPLKTAGISCPATSLPW